MPGEVAGLLVEDLMVPLADREGVARTISQPVTGVPVRPLHPHFVVFREPRRLLVSKIPTEVLAPGEERRLRARAPLQEERQSPVGFGGVAVVGGATGEFIENRIERGVVLRIGAAERTVVVAEPLDRGDGRRVEQPARPTVERGGEQRRVLGTVGVAGVADHRVGIPPHDAEQFGLTRGFSDRHGTRDDRRRGGGPQQGRADEYGDLHRGVCQRQDAGSTERSGARSAIPDREPFIVAVRLVVSTPIPRLSSCRFRRRKDPADDRPPGRVARRRRTHQPRRRVAEEP
jgi:hypothetical protein